MLAPPTVTRDELAFLDVAIAAPAPATPAGMVPVWKIRTDGAGIDSVTLLLQTFPIMKTIGIEQIYGESLTLSDDAEVGGNLEVNNNLTVDGATDLSGNVNLGTGTGNKTIAVGSDGSDIFTCSAAATLSDNVNLGTGTGNKTIVLGSDNSDVVTVNAKITSSLVATAGVTLGTTSADALAVNSTATFNSPVVLGTSATSTINALMSFVAAGAPSGGIAGDSSAVITWSGPAAFSGSLSITGSSSVAGQLGQDGSSNLQWTDATSTKYVHSNPSGWVRGHGQLATTGGAAASVVVDTNANCAPKVASNLDVRAEAWVSRAAAGAVTLTLTEVGVGAIGTTGTIVVVATAANTFTQVCFSRTHSASTTPRLYRFTVDGGGSNVTVINARITVDPVN